MPRRDVAVLSGLLLVTLALRVPVLGWGLPPTRPEVVASDIRSSYAFDEDDILTAVSFTRPAKFDFDPRLYSLGTLHLHVMNLLLDGFESLGYFNQPWRDAYYNMISGEFERVYRLARALSVAFGLLCIAAVYLLGRELDGSQTAFWASAICAASPAHMLASVQIRVDLTMAALVALAGCGRNGNVMCAACSCTESAPASRSPRSTRPCS